MSRFLLKLKHGMAAPAMDPPAAIVRPEKIAQAVVNDPEAAELGIPERCHAYLSAFDATPDAVNTYSNVDKYVVIGRGFAATTNLATMRLGGDKARWTGTQMYVVGKADPWSRYVSHNMNQEVELLTLPGYTATPQIEAPHAAPRWLRSNIFADCNAEELTRAVAVSVDDAWPGVTQQNSGVRGIEKFMKDDLERFRIFLEGEQEPIVATKVDICTGTGQQLYAEGSGARGIQMCDLLWQEYLTPPNGTQPRISSAEMFVAGPCQVRANASVLITSANSPAGIQAGEHALGLDHGNLANPPADEVVLMASETMNGGFLPIGRLDALGRTRAGALPVRLVHPLADALFPTNPKMWFAEKYRPAKIEILNAEHVARFLHADGDRPIDAVGIGTQLLVTFSAPGPAARFVQGVPLGTQIAAVAPSLPPPPPLEYGLFDQVVISTGRARGGRGAQVQNEPGSAMQLVWPFQGELQHIPADGYDVSVGLKTPLGNLRILGAAGINSPLYKAIDDDQGDLKAIEDSLPWQARVNGEGVTLAALTIAMANNFFRSEGARINRCVNTASLKELKAVFGNGLGNDIFLARHDRVRPFQSQLELFRVLSYRMNLHELDIPATITLLNTYSELTSEQTWNRYHMHPSRWRRNGEFKEALRIQRQWAAKGHPLITRYQLVVP